MAAVISGGGLGLFDARLLQAGGGQVGQGSANHYVNVATGNLVLQSFDEQLLYRGMSLAQSRTYNSMGTFGSTGADGWVTGFERRVDLFAGTFNTPGSVVRRQTGDGTWQDFTYVADNVYVSSDGEGADDTLAFNADGTCTWREGSSMREEDYDASGRLVAIREFKSDGTDPTDWVVAYNADGRIESVSNASGEGLVFGYNGGGQLTSLSTTDGTTVVGQVAYEYDTAGRLTKVVHDLTPGNTSDNARYEIVYTYVDASSLQIASVTQSDGTVVSYTYYGDGRIASATRGTGAAAETLTYIYNADSSTTIRDSLNREWLYKYDAQGRVIEIQAPPIASIREVTTFTYNGDDLIQTQVSRGGTAMSQVDYTYDARGNQLWQWDLLGNAISRTYDANNQLTSETRYTGVDPDRTGAALPTGGLTTRYVYDARSRLRFVVDAAGSVTEFRYATSGTGIGQVVETRQYNTAYTGTVDGNSMASFAAAQQGVYSTSLAVSQYDAWGRLSSTTRYAVADASGNGLPGTANETTNYTYSAQGLLLQQVRVHETAGNEVTTFAYDGMGRLLSSIRGTVGVDGASIATTYLYLDSAQQIAVTMDGGATRTETRDSAGRVLSSATAAAGQVSRITQYYYDAAGQLKATRDANGTLTYSFYDPKGRLNAIVDGTGAITRTVFNDVGRAISTVRYANRVDTSGWLANGEVTMADFAAIGVVVDAVNDRTTTTSYDLAGRAVLDTDALGNKTRYTYDAAGRLLKTLRSDAAETASTARTTRYFYDAADRVVATLDAEGFLVESTYDAMGRVGIVTRYATATTEALRATGTLDELRPTADATNDQVTRHIYDRASHLIGMLDAEGYLTEWIYDEAGHARSERRYRGVAGYQAGDSLTSMRTRAGATDYHETRMQYNALGQLETQVNFEGTITRYQYDEAGRLVMTRQAENGADIREDYVRYNAFDEVTGELHGEAAEGARAALKPYVDGTVAWNDSAVEAIYAQHGTRHAYDVLGRRIESIDAQGNKTWIFYNDALGRTYVVRGMSQDANGTTGALNGWVEITETRTDSFGQVVETLAYTGRMTLATPGSRAAVQTIIDTLSYVAAVDSRRQFAYDKRGMLASVIDAENVESRYTWNAFGERTLEQRAYGTTAQVDIATTYDNRGLATSRTEGFGALQRTTRQTFDAFGRVVNAIDGRGGSIGYGFDRLGRLISTTQSDMDSTAVREFKYDAYNRIVWQEDAFDRRTNFIYDDTARTLTVTSPEGVVTVTTHDRLGQTVSVKVGNSTTSYVYDDSGNLVQTTDPLGKVATQGFDKLDRLIWTADATTRKVEFEYDAAGRVLRRIDDATGERFTTSYNFDAQGRQVKVTDATDRVTTFLYDREGRMVEQIVDPGASGTVNLRTRYTYDALGHTVRVASGFGTGTQSVLSYTFDALGRRTSETIDPDNLKLTTRYVYDANDNLVRKVDANGVSTRYYYYDSANRLIWIIEPLGTMTRNWYDIEGRLTATRTLDRDLATADLRDDTSIQFFEDILATSWSLTCTQSYRIYNDDGRLAYVMDASLTQFVYDSAGRLVSTRRFAGSPYTTGVLPTTGAMFEGTARPEDVNTALIANNSRDEVTWNVYDAAGRVVATIDGVGSVVEFFYDAAGRQLGAKRYGSGRLIDAALRIKLDAGTATLAEVRPGTDPLRPDVYNLTVFDGAGRARFQVDAIGAIRETVYDAAGRVIGTRAYANTINTTPILAAIATGLRSAEASVAGLLVENDARDLRSWNVYDTAGRLAITLDAQDYATRFTYDGAGRLYTERKHYTKPVIDATLRAAIEDGTATLAQVSALLPNHGSDQFSARIFDSAGRVRYVLTLAIGSTYTVEGMRYDALGRMIERAVYATPISSGTALNLANVPYALTIAGGDDPANQRTTRYAYDVEGHLRFTIDDSGFVTEQRYEDGLDRVTLVRSYQQAISTSVAAIEKDVAAAVAGIAVANYRDTAYAYNTRNEVVTITDALGNVETFGYDYAGRKTSYTNKLGAVWTYAYDAAGHLSLETTPVVSVVVWTGTAFSVVSRGITTKYDYDGLGNVLVRTEDYGAGFANRATMYNYDSRGHQIETIFPAAGVVADNGTVSGGTAVSVTVTYDALGRAAVQKDANGFYTYKVYDNLGRLTYEVEQYGTYLTNSTNYVTKYGYDLFGRQTTITRFANTLQLAGVTGTVLNEGLMTQGTNAADRTITTEYDRLGRKTRVLQPSVQTLTAAGAVTTGIPTTRFEYNGFGDLVKESVLISGSEASAPVWASTFNYYDAVGQRIRSVDAEGYVTTWSYYPDGTLKQEYQFARAISTVGLSTSVVPANPATADAGTGWDRTMLYAYDKLGRKVSSKQYLGYSDVNGVGQTRWVETVYAYDDEDHLLTTTADGVLVNTLTYDAMGRTTSVTETARNVLANNYQTQLANGTGLEDAALYVEISPYTSLQYDAFGNATRVVRWANGKNAAGGVTANAGHDQETVTAYDKQGRAVYVRDALGNASYTKYDAAGHAIETWHDLKQGTGTAEVHTYNSYDGSGRLVTTYTMRGLSIEDTRSTVRYNAFGEIVKKGITDAEVNAGTNCAIYIYDNAGRIIRTNADTGAYRDYYYNLAGFQVREAREWTATVKLNYDQDVDKLGRVLQQVVPAPSSTTSPLKVVGITQRYDRWGNVIESIDPRGFSTFYQYDRNNRVTRQYAPMVDVLNETGVFSWIRPLTQYFYNQFGHLVRTIDANGNVRMYTVDNAGQTTQKVDGNGKRSYMAWDALGRQAAEQNALGPQSAQETGMGYVTYTEFDRTDRAIKQGDFTATGANTRVKNTLQTYELDQDGNRTKVTDATGVEMNYQYDSRGLMTRSATESGVTHVYTYDRNGNKLSDLDASGKDNNWTYDYFGRVLTSNDLAGITSTYEYYPECGLLKKVTRGTATTEYEYYVNGQISKLTLKVGAQTQTYQYGYDAAGNRIWDKSTTYDGSGLLTVISTETAYDSHNRVKQVTSEDVNGNRLLELRYDYDANGNRRRIVADSAYQGTTSTYLSKANNPLTRIYNPSNVTVKDGIPTTWRVRVADVFQDPEWNPLSTFSYTGLPAWMGQPTYLPESGELEFTVDGTQAAGASATVIITATDAASQMVPVAGATAWASFIVSVAASTAPTAIDATPIDLPVKTGTNFSSDFDVGSMFADADVGDALTLTATPPAGATWLTAVAVSGAPGVFRIAGTNPPAGTYAVTLRATDKSGASVTRIVNVIVAADRAPVAVANQTVTVAGLTTFSYERDLTQLFADTDDAWVTYTATILGGGAVPSWMNVVVEPGAPSKFRVSGTSPSYSADIIIELKATDANGLTDTMQFKLVFPKNVAPTVIATNPQAQAVRTQVPYTYTAALSSLFTDAAIDTLTYSLVRNGTELPWLTMSIVNGQLTLSGTPSDAQTGSFTARIRATDQEGASSDLVLNFTITAHNKPTYASGTLVNQSAGYNRAFSYVVPANAFTDVDGDALTYTAKLVVGGVEQTLPSWLTFNATTRTFSGTPPVGELGNSFVLRVTASDGDALNVGGTSASGDFTVSVVNNAPTWGAAPATSAGQRNIAWSLNMGQYATDLNGGTLTYSFTGNPTWMTINATTGVLSGTSTVEGSWPVTVTVTDSQGATASRLVTVTIGNVVPVVANPIADRTIEPSVPWSFAVPANTFTDANNDTLTWATPTGMPTWMSWNATTRTLSGTPTAVGSWTVTLSVSDGFGGTITDAFVVTVPNRAPILPVIPNQSAPANGGAWSYQMPAATDPNGTTPTLTATGMPSWMTFTAGTRTFSGTPAAAGSWTITVTASDGSLTDTATFTVTTANVAPRVVTAIPDQAATQWVAWSYAFPAGAFADYNGTPALTYTATGLPPGVTFNASTRTFSGTPTRSGTYAITVTASDGTLTISDTFNVNIALGVNHAPTVAAPLPDMDWFGSYTFSATAFTDMDGDTLTYTATYPAGVTFNAGTRTFSGNLFGGQMGRSYTFTVTASDGRGGSVSDSFTVYVEGIGDPLIAGGDNTYSMQMMEPSAMQMLLPPDDPGDGGGGGGGGGGYEVEPPPPPPPVPTASDASHQELWFTYDGENRVEIHNGTMVGGLIQMYVDKQSYTNEYDSVGNVIVRRRLELDSATQQNIVKLTEMQYTERGQLASTTHEHKLNVNRGIAATYTYDAAGRQDVMRTYYANDYSRTWRSGNPSDPDTEWYTVTMAGWASTKSDTDYDVDGRVSKVTESGRGVDRWFVNNALLPENITAAELARQKTDAVLELTTQVLYTKGDGSSGYDNTGKLTNYVFKHFATSSYTSDITYSNLYTYAYAARDSYLETSVTGTNQEGNSTIKIGSTYSLYDDFGRRETVQENLYDTAGGLHHTGRAFAYDGNGQIIIRRDGDMAQGTQVLSTQRSKEHYRYANGSQVAHQNENGKFDVTTQMTGFDSEAPSAMVVDGDTLRSISQRVYGSDEYWYILADANGLEYDAELTVGMELKAPKLRTSTNDASTFKPYNPDEIIGPTAVPAVVTHIPPPSRKECDTLMVVFTVVAIVWIACAAGAAAQYVTSAMPATASAATTAVAAGATYGAVSGVGNALVTKANGGGFSLRNVAASIVTSTLTGGGSGIGEAGASVAAQAGQLLLNATASYVGQKIAGMDVSFSWRSIAASAITSYVGSKLGATMDKQFRLANRVVAGAADAVIGAASSYVARRAVGLDADMDTRAIVIDAFQNVLANAIASAQADSPATPGGKSKKRADISSIEIEQEKLGIEPIELQLLPPGEVRGIETHVVEKGDSISGILGTSDPAQIGLFMARNGLTDSTLRIGQELVLGGSLSDYTDDEKSALGQYGQSVLNQDNARIEAMRARAEALATASAREEARMGPWVVGMKLDARTSEDVAYGLSLANRRYAQRSGTGSNQSAQYLPEIRNLYTPRRGHWEVTHDEYMTGARDSNAPWGVQALGWVGGAATFVPMLLDSTYSGWVNFGNTASLGGQKLAMATLMPSGPDSNIMMAEGALDLTKAFLDAGNLFTLGTGTVLTRSVSAPMKQELVATARAPSRLTPEMRKTFANGEAVEIVLDKPLVVQRFHGGGSAAKGSFATTDVLKSRVDVRERLALPRTWITGAEGNAVTKVTTIELPAGTRIWSGSAAPQFDGVTGRLYGGGGNQVFIDDWIQDAWVKETKWFHPNRGAN